MKFSNIKNNTKTVALLIVFLANAALLKPTTVNDKQKNQRLECGKRAGATLALLLFKLNDNRPFLDYIEQFKKIITDYCQYFDEKTITTATKILNDIEAYIKIQYSNKRRISPNKVAALLTKLTKSLPDDVIEQFDKTFEELQLKLLNRSKPLWPHQLLVPLSNRLNQKKTTPSSALTT